MDNRPKGREKNVTGTGKDIYKRGEGLGTGPVGSADGHQGKAQASGGQTSGRASSGAAPTRSGGRGLIGIILAAVVLLGGGGFGLSSIFGGSDDTSSAYTQSATQSVTTQSATTQSATTSTGSSGYASSSSGSSASSASGSLLTGLLGGLSSSSASTYGNVSTGWSNPANTRQLDTTVAQGARDKRTQILGGGQDTVTIMVYMCGTDLESKYGMGTADLQEMAAATLSNKVNLIVYTGGCKQWKNNTVSSSVNQIYKVESGGLRCLVSNAGTDSMVKASTLTGFIQYCTQNYPANRNELIFWDHGGGSLSGYGYDEKNPTAGSMNLKSIQDALRAAGTTFDFIGFDACLMASLENALMLTDYADYLIASEETEPGVGWYYTNWLTNLSANTSQSTLDLGKNIIDDFVAVCNQRCAGQKTTLSLVDLAELEATVPEAFKTFATGTSELLQSNEYQTVSSARSNTREFATSSKIDQIDLVDLAYNLGTEEGQALAETLLGAIKYNSTSSSITNAYGLSIYFPYQKTNKVNSAVATYSAIGMDDEYARCIQQFASLESAGQSASGMSASPLSSLLGGATGSASSAMSSDAVSQLLSSLLGAGVSGRSIDVDAAAQYLTENQLDAGQLVWTPSGDSYQLTLSENQWSLVNGLDLNVFYDDGEGFIDLGLDNVFEFTDDGALIGEYDGTWLAIDDQPVAYYHTGTVYDGDAYTITGRVPVMLNGERAELLLVFDNENPYGYIAGARSDYDESETETIAKGITELTVGDRIDFICDYYAYDGTYQDSYYLGETCTYTGSEVISNVYIDASAAQATYRFTDIYNQQYWTPAIP